MKHHSNGASFKIDWNIPIQLQYKNRTNVCNIGLVFIAWIDSCLVWYLDRVCTNFNSPTELEYVCYLSIVRLHWLGPRIYVIFLFKQQFYIRIAGGRRTRDYAQCSSTRGVSMYVCTFKYPVRYRSLQGEKT